MANHAGGAPVSARRWAARVFWGLLALGALAGFLALGQWQVERRAWKLDLIQRVEERVHADPLTAPRPMDWDGVNEDRDEYRPVRLHGTYHDALHLYFLLEPVMDGEHLGLLNKCRDDVIGNEPFVRFVAAALGLALQHMHSRFVILSDYCIIILLDYY